MTAPASIEAVHELAPLQQGILFHTLYAPASAVHNLRIVLSLEGEVDDSAFDRGWAALVDRHAVLRTSFVWERVEKPYQVVRRQVALTVERFDWRGLDHAEQERRLERLLDEDATRRLDLTKAPLFRVALARSGARSYTLVWTFHHILLEGWSAAIVLREFWALYAGFCTGVSPQLATVRSYSDYLTWLGQQDDGKAERYWREKLGGFDTPTRLPIDGSTASTPAEVTYVRSCTATLTADAVTTLRRLARTWRVTPNTIIQGAWALLLGRYSGTTDVLFGSVVAGRPADLPGSDAIVGLFVNTLPTRVRLPGEKPVSAWLQELQLDQATMRGYEYSSLMRVHSWSDVAGGKPLFHSVVAFQNWLGDLPAGQVAPDLQVVGSGTRNTSDQPLTLFGNWGQTVALTLVYDIERFTEPPVRRLLEHLTALLDAMVANPDGRLSDLQLLTGDERRQLDAWNATSAEFPRAVTVHELVFAQAGRSPEATAVRTGSDTLTYRELERRAVAVAQALRARGVGRGHRVGLCLDRGADMLAAVLGVLQSGAAYVPLDPSFPAERLRFMANDADVSMLVSTSRLAPLLALPRERQLLLDAGDETIGSASAMPADLDRAANADDPAYVIYTSGSTGTPKGVVVPHRAVVNFLTSMTRTPGLTADDVLVAVTTLSFDIAVLELYLPLTVGATVVIATREDATDGRALARLLETRHATKMQATPVTWRLLLEAGWRAAPGFTAALVGGETLPVDLADQLLAQDVEVWNMYGPTETTVWSTCGRIADTIRGITIGRPIANTVVRILDVHGQLCPVGVPGELCIGGEGLALGYWQRPELTVERFVPDRFSSTTGSRLYRTGDRAQWRDDGTIEHLGRLDFQVKLRGHRIELGEIEARLQQQSGVAQSAVVVREDRAGDRRLVGYVVAAPGALPDVAALREGLRVTLPDYMVPAAFVLLAGLPLTPNGKVDRSVLPAPDFVPATAPTAASDDYEIVLGAIFERVLGISRIGGDDSFFDLGGHSLLAVQLITQIESTFGRVLPLATLFEAPTVAGLATVLRREGWTPPWDSLVALQPHGTRRPFFCVHSLGSNLVSYRKLAGLVGDDQPFYGLQPHGLDGSKEPHERVEDMAAHYIREIRTVQPHGPYRLGGVCLGGIIAFEMAQQLKAGGESVSLVAMIDSYFPGTPPHQRPDLRRRWGLTTAADYYLGDVLLRSPKDRVVYVLTRVVNIAGRIRRAVRTLAGRPERDQGTLLRVLKRIQEANRQAERRYEPRRYDGRIHLLWCSEFALRAYQDTRLAWSDYAADGLETVVIPGNHMSMVEEPHVQVLATALRRCLDRTDRHSDTAPV